MKNSKVSTKSSFNEIYDEIDKYEKNDIKAFPIINILIQKTKNEKDYTQLYRSYRKAAAHAPPDLEIFMQTVVFGQQNIQQIPLC